MLTTAIKRKGYIWPGGIDATRQAFMWNKRMAAYSLVDHPLVRQPSHGNKDCPIMLEAPTVKALYVVQIRCRPYDDTMLERMAMLAMAHAREALQAMTLHDTTVEMFTTNVPIAPKPRPSSPRPYTGGSETMVQRLYTIEFRVDVKDESKLDVIEALGKQAACHVLGQCALLGDHIKPEVVFFSHDYFYGHRNIAVLDDDVMNGTRAVTEASNARIIATQSSGAEEPPPISSELLAALKQ